MVIFLIGLTGILTYFMLIEISSVLGALIVLGSTVAVTEMLWFESLLYRTKHNTPPNRAFTHGQTTSQPIIVAITLLTITGSFAISYFVPDWTISLMVLVITVFWAGLYGVLIRPYVLGSIVEKHLS